ncbi:hypothetical protein EV424DRAFT_1342859 [Suillus variegatus]|nr:hypothetical protein EV424DRAFT_1342859 [Suillus variegatus]
MPIPLAPHPPTHDYGIWVNTSTGTGISILWNGYWAAWSTTPNDNQGIIGAFQKGRSANFQSIYALDDPRSYYIPSHEVYILPHICTCPLLPPFPSPYTVSFAMQESDLYCKFMKGMGIQVATDEFWASLWPRSEHTQKVYSLLSVPEL